jgi:CheY-like chemotaxis protein/two-component sensor histidine kinase
MVPLLTGSGEYIGTLFATMYGKQKLRQDELQVFSDLGPTIALSILHRRTEESLTLRKKLEEEREIYIQKIFANEHTEYVYKELLGILKMSYNFNNIVLLSHKKQKGFSVLAKTGERKMWVSSVLKITNQLLHDNSSNRRFNSFLYNDVSNIKSITEIEELIGSRLSDENKTAKRFNSLLKNRVCIILKVSTDIIAFGIVNDELPLSASSSLLYVLQITHLRLNDIINKRKMEQLAKLEKERANIALQMARQYDEEGVLSLSVEFLKQSYDLSNLSVFFEQDNKLVMVKSDFELPISVRRNLGELTHFVYVPLSENRNTIVNFFNKKNQQWKIIEGDEMQIRGMRFKDVRPGIKSAIQKLLAVLVKKNARKILLFKLPNLGCVAAVINNSLNEQQINIIGETLATLSNRILFIRNDLELQVFKKQEIRSESLERTSWAIGHKLNNLLLQAENAYHIGNDISTIFKEFSVQVQGLMEQTQSREVPEKLININEFARNICDLNFYQQKNISVQYNFSHEDLFVYMKTAVLRDILINLVRNALVHGKADVIKIITHNIENEGVMLAILEIWDNGKGVPQEVLLKGLGKPGNTTYELGTGMGLYQVIKDLADYNGQLEYKRQSRYSKFIISLPMAHIYEDVSAQKPLDHIELKDKNIILVDDEESNLAIYRDVYRSIGFLPENIYTAVTIEEAIEKYDTLSDSICFVLCDMYMGGKTGMSLYTYIRSKDIDTYFCFISGNSELPEIIDARRVNPSRTGFLQKGVDRLAGFEHLALRAVRKIDLPALGTTGQQSRQVYDTPVLFIDGFVHRINNLLIYPMSLSEMVLSGNGATALGSPLQ